MKLTSLLLFLCMGLILFLTGCGDPQVQLIGNAPSIYYTANEEGTISKIDPVTNTVIKTVPVEGSVHNVQVSPDGKTLGATIVPKADDHGGHNDAEGKGFALLFDTATDELVTKVEVGGHPAHIEFTKNGRYILVTNNADNNISIIDARTYKASKTIPTGKGPHGFRISHDSRFAYVANMGEDSVSVLDLVSFKEKKKIMVGQTPITAGTTKGGKTLVVTLYQEDALAVVDLQANTVEKVKVGKGPAQVFIQSDDRYAWVANQGTKEQPSDTVTKIDLNTRLVAATIQVGKGAHGIVTSMDNEFIYVTNMFDNTVSVIDNQQDKVIQTLQVGKNPNGITYRP